LISVVFFSVIYLVLA